MKRITLVLALWIIVVGVHAQNYKPYMLKTNGVKRDLTLQKDENIFNKSQISNYLKNDQGSFFNSVEVNDDQNRIKYASQLRNWLLSEDFENLTAPWPEGWRTISTSDLIGSDATTTDYTTGINTWSPIDSESFGTGGEELVYEGEYSVAIGANAGSVGNSFSWLVTPEVTLPTDEAFLHFNIWYANSTENNWLTNFYVNILTNGEWKTILSWKGAEGAEINLYTEPVVLNLIDYLGENVTLAFVYEYNDGFQVALDNIFIGNLPENDLEVSLLANMEEPFVEGERVLFSAEVENIGSSTQSDVQVSFKIDGVETLVKTISSIKSEEVKTVYFPWTVKKGTSEIKAVLPVDDEELNNIALFNVNALFEGQLYETFDEEIFPPMYWSTNVINDHDWIRGQGYDSYASAMYLSSENNGIAELITPRLDLTVSETDSISFYYESSSHEWVGQDSLEILISTNGGENWRELGFLGMVSEFTYFSFDLEEYEQTNDTYIKFVAHDHDGLDIRIDEVKGPKINIQADEAGLTSFGNEKLASGGFVTEGLRDITVELKNYGLGNLNSAKIYLEINENGDIIDFPAYEWTGELLPGETEIVNIDSYKFVADNGYVVKAYISESNGAEDIYKENNEISSSFLAIYAGQLAEDFEGDFPPVGWKMINNGSPESFYQEPFSHTPGSVYSACTPFSSTGVPNSDWLITPKLEPTASNNRLTFWMVSFGDEFIDIKISTTGNEPADFDIYVGQVMPSEQYEWYGYSIDLSAYVGQEIYVAYRNGDGTKGAAAIDDVMGPILAGLGEDDLSVNEVIYPEGYTYVGEEVIIKAVIQNAGSAVNSGRDLKFLVDGTEKGTIEIGEILPGDVQTVNINFVLEKHGLQNFEVKFSTEDANNDNNSNSVDGIVATYEMLTESFEGNKAPAGWDFGEWFAGTYESAVEGSNIAVCAFPYGYENVILSTPKVKIDGTYPTVYFYAHGINFINDSYYSVKLAYSEDGKNWNALNDSVTLTPEMELYQFDLSGIEDGEYYLGFAASSNFNYEASEGITVIDFIFGPEVIKTHAISYTPAEGESNVEKDAEVSVVFDRDIDEIDLYGVTIEGSTDGLIQNVEAYIMGDKRTIKITHDSFSATAQRFKVTIPENSVLELDGIYSNSKTVWNFITGNSTSIEDIQEFETEILAYPNPATDKLYISAPDFKEGSILTIGKLTGSIILSKVLSNEMAELDINDLSTGIYIIMINDGTKIATQKFIKK